MGSSEVNSAHDENTVRNPRVPTVMVVGGPSFLARVEQSLRKGGVRCEFAGNAADAFRRLAEEEFDAVIVNADLAGLTGSEFSKVSRLLQPGAEVYLLVGDASEKPTFHVTSSDGGESAGDSIGLDRLAASVWEEWGSTAEGGGEMLEVPLHEKAIFFGDMVGRCQQMQQVFRLIEKVAGTTAPVIIQGESGTGKELVARALHDNSPRKNQRFLAINSASLPETLLESELFGYRRGAFTGAQRDKKGLLESANDGTLLLDEIGSMSKHLQGKLLRAMQDGEILPVGSSQRIKIDVRVLAASNRNLADMVASGEFRKDLFYRLNVIEISLPALRERREDIPALVEHFLRKYGQDQGMKGKAIGKPAWRVLLKYSWPGNVRELENVVRRALIMSRGRVIRAEDIQLKEPGRPNLSSRPDLLSMKYRDAKSHVQSEFQKAYVQRILSECGGNISRAAARAGLSRQALHQMAKQYGLK